MPPDPVKSDKPMKRSFYAYRAMCGSEVMSCRPGTSAEARFENVNLANLQGVLGYLHHEVLGYTRCNKYTGITTQVYGIDRIRRYNITMFNTPAVAPAHTEPHASHVRLALAGCDASQYA